nr:integrase, catalytic region, zinc finger, CCHC-type, peptidase aspartic, catalytic [Tanacetum cinerariifolium]
ASKERLDVMKYLMAYKLKPGSSICAFVKEMKGYFERLESLNMVFDAELSINIILSEESFGYLFYKPKDNMVFVARRGLLLEREMISKEDSGSKIDLEEIQESTDEEPKVNTNTQQEFYYVFHIEEDKISDSTLSELDEPANYKEAMASPKAVKWKEAMKSEIHSMYDNQVWNLVDTTPSLKTVESKIMSIRIMLAIAAFHDYEIRKMDVMTVFLNEKLTDDVFIAQSNGFENAKYPKRVCKHQNAIYGLKQASSSWNLCLHEKVTQFGFSRSKDESYIYVKVSGSFVVFMIGKDLCPKTNEELDKMRRVPYASAIGSIMYAMMCTRPDVSFALSMNPPPEYLVYSNLLSSSYYMKIYKPTKNNFRTSSNSRNKNVDTTLRYKNDNHSGQFGNQRTVNVAGARENEVPTAHSGTDSEPLEQVQNDARYNVFSNDLQYSEHSKSINNTCLVETDDSNVIPDSPDMCNDDIQNDQNDVESNDEQTSKTLGESNSVWDSCLIALQNKQTEFEKYKAFNDRTVDYDKLEHMEILIQTCLMPLAIKTQNDSFIFVHELKQEMHAGLKYVESLEKEIDELESDKAEFSNMYDMILQECVSNDVMCSYFLSLSDLDALAELQCLYLHKVKECDCLAQKLLNQIESVSKEVQTELLQCFAKVEKHSISFEIALQKCKERVKNDTVWKEQASNVFRKESKQYIKIQDLKAQLQDKNIAISKPAPFSNSLERRYFSKTKSVPKTNMSEGLSKPVTTQTLPQTTRQAIVQLILFIVDYGCTKHMTGNLKLLCNFVKKFMGTVCFGNDQFAPILRYGDLVQQNVMINRVYYIEGLNHNLFSVGQFCDADLEVSFQKSTCVVRDLHGNDLLTGNRGSDLYTSSLQESTSSTPLCLIAKASPTQAWLWHRRLSHLNFDYINLLSKKDIVIGLPKLKYVKNQLCSSCELSKAKRSSFKLKVVPSSKGRLNLLHMDLCG